MFDESTKEKNKKSAVKCDLIHKIRPFPMEDIRLSA